MGFIILGVILAVGVFHLRMRIDDGNIVIPLLISAVLLLFFGGVCGGLFTATGEYKSPIELQTVELQALTDQTASTGGGRFYVSINASNAYTYYTQVESEFANGDSKAYVSRSVSGDNITVVEEENCQTPRLTEYKQNPCITFWSFGLTCQKKQYVFYVPKGTIAHEIALGQ